MKYNSKIFILTFLLIIPLLANNIASSTAYTSVHPEEQVIDEIIADTFTGVTKITMFSGPDSAYEVVYNSVLDAKTSFYLEVYTLSSEALVDALIAAKGRGVDVIVLLSHDRVSGYEDNYTEESAYRLVSAGIDVLWTSSTFRFTHAKFWIVDSQTAYVYSGNWAPSSIPISPAARTNREMGLAFNDTSIATYYEDVFLDDMLMSSPYEGLPNIGYLQAEEDSETYTHPFTQTTITEYAEVTPIFSPDNSYELVSELIQSAQSTIDVELQYIKFDCDALNDLIDAALRGVSVRVLIPKPGVSNENVTEVLINAGASVRFFKGLGHNHNKYISVDGETVQISSINWSNNSFVNNREAGAIVKNPTVADYFKEIFDFDWDQSEIPSGYMSPITIISPKNGAIISSTHTFQIAFNLLNFTSGDLYIDDLLVTSWSNPNGTVTFDFITTSISDGYHKINVTGDVDGGDTITTDQLVNIINTDDWKLLITEVRFDASNEPEGEYFELYNYFDFTVCIGSWIVSDKEDDYVLPTDAIIASEEVFIFARDEAVFISEMVDLGVDYNLPDFVYTDILLANTGDELILYDSDEIIRDVVVWGSGSVSGVVAWSGTASASTTLQRDPAQTDTNNCNEDFQLLAPSPGVVSVESVNEFVGFSSPIIIISAIMIYGLASIIVRKRRK